MDYITGGTLRDRYPKGSRVPLVEVVKLTIQLASALQYAHDHHLVHRDVKPENMLCRADGMILLSDFGIASVAHASSSASAYQGFGGTLPYMAPEQHAGKLRPASDQYALAVVAYEWLAGTRPFQGTMLELMSQHMHAPPPSLLDHVPTLLVQVEQVVFKALSKQPQELFARVDDFALALQAAKGPSITSLSPVPFSPPRTALPVIKSGEARGDLSSSVPLRVSSQVRIGVNQPLPLEVTPTLPSSADTRSAEGVSDRVALSMLASGPRPILHRKEPDLRMLFTFSIIFLIVLSGSGLFYVVSGGQRTLTQSPSQARRPTLSPFQQAQAGAATATAAAQTYATMTARQGVMFSFDAAHTNDDPYEQTIAPGNVSRLKHLWSFTLGGTSFSVGTTSSPAVAGGLVYVGSDDHNLYAFDATCRTKCQPLWSFATGDAIISTPAIAGGLVYVSSNDYKLYALTKPLLTWLLSSMSCK